MCVSDLYELSSLDQNTLDQFCNSSPIGLEWCLETDDGDEPVPPFVVITHSDTGDTFMILLPDLNRGQGWVIFSSTSNERPWFPSVHAALTRGSHVNHQAA